MDKVTKKFITDWGRNTYKLVLKSAIEHGNGINDKKIGHELKHALLICIGFQCMEKPDFQKHHGFVGLDWNKMKKWIKDNAELKTYKGDLDYLSLMCGVYDEYI